MRRVHTAVVVVAVALLLAGCGGDDGSSETDASSTGAPLSTSLRSPSSPASSTSTTAATTTTTTDPIAATEEAVEQAALQSRADYLYAIESYDATDAVARLEQSIVVGSPSMSEALEFMETFRRNGWHSRPNPDVPESAVVEDIALLDGPPATQAEVVWCIVSPSIVFEPPSVEGGSEVIVNDEIVARRSRSTFVLDAGTWKLDHGDSLGEWSGVTSCPAA